MMIGEKTSEKNILHLMNFMKNIGQTNQHLQTVLGYLLIGVIVLNLTMKVNQDFLELNDM